MTHHVHVNTKAEITDCSKGESFPLTRLYLFLYTPTTHKSQCFTHNTGSVVQKTLEREKKINTLHYESKENKTKLSPCY